MTKVAIPRRRALILSGGALAAPMIASGIARAQSDWPNRPVKYIVVFPAGGPTDTLSRIVCQELSELTGQQFIIENRAGSGGNIGADIIAKSAPDGYTIGLYTIAAHAIAPTLYAKLPFDAGKDFTGIATLWAVPNMLMTRLRLPRQHHPRADRAGEGQSGQVLLRFVGRRHQPSPHGRDVQADGRRQPAARSLQGQRARASGHPGGPGRHDVRQHSRPARPDEGRQGQRLRGHLEGAPSGGSRQADLLGVPAGLRDHLVGRHLRAGRRAAGNGREALRLTKQALQKPSVKAAFDQQGAAQTWRSPSDTMAFRAAEEKKLAPVIKASGAKVE